MSHTQTAIHFKGAPVKFKDDGILKLRDLVIECPYKVVEIDSRRPKYEDYIVTIINECDEELRIYMPKRFIDECAPGKVFVYYGKQPVKSSPGHTFHCMKWGELN